MGKWCFLVICSLLLVACSIDRQPRPSRQVTLAVRGDRTVPGAGNQTAVSDPVDGGAPDVQVAPEAAMPMPTGPRDTDPTRTPMMMGDAGLPGTGPAMDVPDLGDDLIPDAGPPVDDVTCNLAGQWGMEVTVDVVWGGRTGGLAALTDDGRGTIIVHMLASLEGVDDSGAFLGNVRVCGAALPPFYSSTLCESYQPTFPSWVWNSVTMPGLPLTGNAECQNPGCAMRFNPAVGLLGIDMQQPLAAWPSAGQTHGIVCLDGTGEACFPDHDDNGLLGITVEMVTDGVAPRAPFGICTAGYAYRAPPLREDPVAIINGVRRADRLHLGTRTTLGGIAVLSDCEHGRGGGIAQGFASRAIGCLAQPGSVDLGLGAPATEEEPCTEAQRQFIDENLPEYRILAAGQPPPPDLALEDTAVSAGPSFTVVRLGAFEDDIGCREVRQADYAP